MKASTQIYSTTFEGFDNGMSIKKTFTETGTYTVKMKVEAVYPTAGAKTAEASQQINICKNNELCKVCSMNGKCQYKAGKQFCGTGINQNKAMECKEVNGCVVATLKQDCNSLTSGTVQYTCSLSVTLATCEKVSGVAGTSPMAMKLGGDSPMVMKAEGSPMILKVII